MELKVIDSSKTLNMNIVESGDLIIDLSDDNYVYRVNASSGEGLYFVALTGSNFWDTKPLKFDFGLGSSCTLKSVKEFLGHDSFKLIKSDNYKLTLEILR